MEIQPEEEESFLLGPFFNVDSDRTEICPVGFEESAEPLESCMGGYSVRSNEPALNALTFKITNKDVTAFIQADWGRVFGPVPPARGFLLAYRSGAFAAGRVAEEVVLQKLLSGALIFGSRVKEMLLFSEAQERSLVVRSKGSQSDDLILILEDGQSLILESKAAFAGKGYLRRSLPKALSQLSATIRNNPNLTGAVLCLIDLGDHRVVVVSIQVEDLAPAKLPETVLKIKSMFTQ
jgi:hypothetical protein